MSFGHEPRHVEQLPAEISIPLIHGAELPPGWYGNLAVSRVSDAGGELLVFTDANQPEQVCSACGRRLEVACDMVTIDNPPVLQVLGAWICPIGLSWYCANRRER